MTAPIFAKNWPGSTGFREEGFGVVGHGTSRQERRGVARIGWVRPVMVRRGKAGLATRGFVRKGVARPDSEWFGKVWQDWYGIVRPCLASSCGVR